MGFKEEASTGMKAVLMKNMKSFSVWHIYGLLKKTNKEFKEANSAFKTAHKMDEKNLNVMRDMAHC